MKPPLGTLLELATPVHGPDQDALQKWAARMEANDWPVLARLMRQHRVEALASRVLDACPSVEIPDETRDALRKAVHRNQLHAMKMVAEFRALSTACTAEGVSIAPLKGVDLVQRVYANPGMRPFEDMDLLVKESDVPAVARVLRKLGYRTPAKLLPHRILKMFHFHLPFWHRRKRIFIEIHWRLTDARTLPAGSEEDVWQAIRDARGPYPHLPDTLYACYLALHISKHGYLNDRLAAHPRRRELALHPHAELRLIWFVDLYHLLARVDDAPASVVELADRFGCGRAVRDTLAIANALWHEGPATDESPQETWVERRMKDRLMTGMLADIDTAAGYSRELPWFLKTNKVLHVRPIRMLGLGRGVA